MKTKKGRNSYIKIFNDKKMIKVLFYKVNKEKK